MGAVQSSVASAAKWTHKDQRFCFSLIGLGYYGRNYQMCQGELKEIDEELRKSIEEGYSNRYAGGGRCFDGPLEQLYYSDAEAIVFIVNSVAGRMMEECKQELERVLNLEWIEGLPLLVVIKRSMDHATVQEVDIGNEGITSQEVSKNQEDVVTSQVVANSREDNTTMKYIDGLSIEDITDSLGLRTLTGRPWYVADLVGGHWTEGTEWLKTSLVYQRTARKTIKRLLFGKKALEANYGAAVLKKIKKMFPVSHTHKKP